MTDARRLLKGVNVLGMMGDNPVIRTEQGRTSAVRRRFED